MLYCRNALHENIAQIKGGKLNFRLWYGRFVKSEAYENTHTHAVPRNRPKSQTMRENYLCFDALSLLISSISHLEIPFIKSPREIDWLRFLANASDRRSKTSIEKNCAMLDRVGLYLQIPLSLPPSHFVSVLAQFSVVYHTRTYTRSRPNIRMYRNINEKGTKATCPTNTYYVYTTNNSKTTSSISFNVLLFGYSI